LDPLVDESEDEDGDEGVVPTGSFVPDGSFEPEDFDPVVDFDRESVL
jgi:hypothetical protein